MYNPFAKSYNQYEIELFQFLVRNKLFENLTKRELLRFIPHLYLRQYENNEVIFFRNDPSHALYIIKTGIVSLQMDMIESFETFAFISDYASIGNNALLEKSKKLYNAVVHSENASIYVLPQVNIMDIFSRSPKIKAKMLDSLATIYNENSTHLFKAYQSTRGFFNLTEIHKGLMYGE